jgi:hypothetical protein
VSEDGERLEELAHAVLGPLVLGGTITPVRPFGPRLALRFAEGRRVVDDDLRTRIDVARVRVARQLAPVDALPDVAPPEWALVAAFNDLVQVTNHELSSPLSRGRHARLLALVQELCAAVTPCATAMDALCRHAILGRMLGAFRTDASLRWWTGSAQFRGRPVSKRLSAWPELRKVHVERTRVPLVQMVDGIAGVTADDYQRAIAALLARTPLTDLATCARATPAFAWAADTLALVAAPMGRRLAARAIARAGTPSAARAALEAATARTGTLPAAAADAVQALVAELVPRDVEALRPR